jgi:hypothetical protein
VRRRSTAAGVARLCLLPKDAKGQIGGMAEGSFLEFDSMAFDKTGKRFAWRLFVGAAATLGAAWTNDAPAQSRNDTAGRYSVLRAEDKDTGCMLTLEQRPASGGFKAQLAPACRDNGLVIFDPVAWNLDHGRLSLTARKGHKIHFDRQPNGVWVRDPKEGKALSLRPL